MALNPPMFEETLTPMKKNGELFLLQRDGISFELQTTGFPKLSAGKGILYLTTSRIVYVAQPPKTMRGGFVFKSFEIPLEGITGEKFNQPIFGANNLTGTVAATPGMGLTSESKFKLTFFRGGVGVFLKFFFEALMDSRDPSRQTFTLATTQILTSMAVVDPNDPSVIYLSQDDIPTAQNDDRGKSTAL